MSGRVTAIAGSVSAFASAGVLLAWAMGASSITGLVSGWRVMVPSSAFGFICIGIGQAAAASLQRRAAAPAVRLAALAAAVIPILTLAEYATGLRFGVESWLGISFASQPPDPYAGRMSPVTAATFVLLAVALGALTRTGPAASRIVRLAAGSALAISWLAVLAVSFEESRINDTPLFPGMAATTIVLFAVSSAGILACSSSAVARLRDADLDVMISRGLIAGAFVLPLLLAAARAELVRIIDSGLAVAIVTVALALAISALFWRAAARLRDLRRQRSLLFVELEARVAERTRELAAANEQLRRSEERLLEADRRKDDFLATLAHELRNPLAPIRTSVQLLKNAATPAHVRAQAHQVIDRQVEHTVRLIDDLLDVSRIAAGKLQLRKDPVDVEDVLRQAAELAAPAIERGRHHVDLRPPPAPLTVAGDVTRLTQVVANLLQNACKYTPPGGHIEVGASAEAGHAVIRVRDDGIGIPPAFLPRLFEKFTQGAPALDRSEGGLGLGLAVVHGIVTMHGGSVAVHSEGSGRGSEFIVRLPLTRAAAPELDGGAPGTGAVAAPLEPRRVLVADDNDDNTAALATLLRLQGHEVETASDGQSAYEAAERFRPDIVLLDLGMPKISGYEVCRRIRRQPWGREIRVIAQTGWGQAHDRRQTVEAGFDDHLVKPIDPEDLVALMRV